MLIIFRFPKNESLKKAWCVAIKRADSKKSWKLWKPYNRAVVCSKHFKDSDYNPVYNRRTLYPEAVPSCNSISSKLVEISRPSKWISIKKNEEKKEELKDYLQQKKDENVAKVLCNIQKEHSYAIQKSAKQLQDNNAYLIKKLDQKCQSICNANKRLKSRSVAMSELNIKLDSLKVECDELRDLLTEYSGKSKNF